MTTKADEMKNELSEMIYRANKVGYKNQPPKLPKNPTTSTLSGFVKRFRNWTKGLLYLENETSRQNKRIVKIDTNLLKTTLTK